MGRTIDRKNAKLDVKATPELEAAIQKLADIRFERNFSQATRWLIQLGLQSPEVQAEFAKITTSAN